MSKVQARSFAPSIVRISAYVLLVLCIGLPILVGSCNDYPFQKLTAQTYTEVSDEQRQTASKKVDILFVVDNSGSMKEEQEKLKQNFAAFISELLNQDVNDFQIGIVTTDMDSVKQSGRLQNATGFPKIINGASMTKQKVIDAFVKNTDVGIEGSPYEKGLAAMKAALSAPLITDPSANQGFLRDGALLAVIIVGDEDDCSHDNKINEREFLSDVCYVPESVIMREKDGSPRKDSNGNDVRGQSNLLRPTKDYITFLQGLKDSKGLKRDVIVSGLIGSPKIQIDDPANPGNKRLIDPPGGCKQDPECNEKNGSKHFCGYATTAGQRQCGGCESKDARADVPGFRFYSVIQAFTPGEGADKLWFPICGNNDEFKQALLRFAGAILERINFVVLSKKPSVDPKTGIPYIQVTIVRTDGTKTVVPAAQPTTKACSKDSECGGDFVCGANSKCHGDGWVYFPPIAGGSQARIKLSGNSKKEASTGSNIQVSYAAGQ